MTDRSKKATRARMEVFQALRKELEADFDYTLNKNMQNKLRKVLWPPEQEGE